MHEKYGRSVIARAGGRARGDLALRLHHARVRRGATSRACVSVVEKPDARGRARRTSPRSAATSSRPRSSTALRQTKPGRGGEIQLTDAINLLAQEQAVYAYVFEGGRFDVGNKLDYLKATVELAIEREDVGPDFRAYLAELVQRKKLV